MSWHSQAACNSTDPTLFFPEDGDRRSIATGSVYGPAREVCSSCEVQADCLTYALETFTHHFDYGMWGGTTPEERKALRRQLGIRHASPGKCLHCETEIQVATGERRYCSRACRQAAYRLRQAS